VWGPDELQVAMTGSVQVRHRGQDLPAKNTGRERRFRRDEQAISSAVDQLLKYLQRRNWFRLARSHIGVVMAFLWADPDHARYRWFGERPYILVPVYWFVLIAASQ
jgi:hypothetical protein